MTLKLIPGDPYPYGVLVFMQFLANATREDIDQAVQLTHDELDRLERALGGQGLDKHNYKEEHRRISGKNCKRVEWIVDPKLKKPHQAAVERMAKIAIKLKQLEAKMGAEHN